MARRVLDEVAENDFERAAIREHQRPSRVRRGEFDLDGACRGLRLHLSLQPGLDRQRLQVELAAAFDAGEFQGFLDLALEPGETFASSTVTRTVFDGVERSAELGSLSSEAVVQVPVRAIVTVSLGN